MKPKILVVDNDAEMVGVLARHLEGEGWDVTGVTSGQEASDLLPRNGFAVILTDLVMDGVDGLELLRRAQRVNAGLRVVLMTAYGSLETAITAMRDGAYDYLTKPFRLPEVSLAVRRALDDKRLREENRRLREEVARRHGVEKLLGVSASMQAIRDQILDLANSDAAVLLLGESGTGKELVARAVHWTSARRGGRFVAVNCAAIPETLLESELFGHEKGAFTGATQKRRGLLAEAEGGTLFLDEIADMPLPLQAKLLRVLQDKMVRPVGGRDEIRVDLRVISATNRDVAASLREGKFREDLYYRLAVIPIRLPSLRERPEDIPVLAKHFLDRAAGALGKQFDGFTDDAAQWLAGHRWPGNVREMENVIERAVTLARGSHIGLGDLRIEFASSQISELGVRPTLAELERQYMGKVLAETKGDKEAAAKILGVSVRTLQRKEKEL